MSYLVDFTKNFSGQEVEQPDVIIRKMAKVDWLDRPTADQPQPLSVAPRIEAAE